MAAAAGELLSVRSDVYLLGATLHELLTDRPPHDGEGIRAVLEHAYRSPPPTYPDRVPDELGDIARRAMAREAVDRYPTAAAFAEALDDFGGERVDRRRVGDVEPDGDHVVARWHRRSGA